MAGLMAVSQAVLVDDFDSYNLGAVGTVTSGSWVTSPVPTAGTPLAESISADPTDAGNKVLNVTTNGSAQIGVYGLLTGSEIVTNGTTKTMSLKFYTTATTCDTSFGLTTVDAPNGFANFNVQIALNKGNLMVRNAGTTTTVMTWTANTWYYLWVVIDNTANTYSVYVKTTPANATSADLKATGFAFRAITTNNPDGDIDRFYAIANYGSGVTGGTQELFDDIHIRDGIDLSLPNPGAVSNPSPASGATDVLTTATLSWNTGIDPANPANPNPNITKHYVYMREGDPNLTYVTPVEISAGSPVNATASCTPPLTLELDKTYYWRVDESVNNSSRTDPNTIQGTIWSFAMLKSVPVISQQPSAETRAFVTDASAMLTCKFSSSSPAMVTWYKHVDGTNDTPLSNGGDILITTEDVSGDYTTTLQINTPADADQGYYYCTINNGTPLLSSTTGALIIKKLLAEYLFEGNLLDSAGVNHGQGKSVAGLTEPNSLLASNVNLAFETPGVGGAGTQAVTLDDPDQYVDFGAAAYPKAGSFLAGIGGGLDEGTILCWVKPTTSGTILLNYNDGATTGFGLSLVANSGTADARLDIRGEGPLGEYQVIGTAQGRPNRPDWDIFDGAWHLIAVTWNTGGNLVLYVDGQQVSSVAAATPDRYLAWQRGVLLGTSRTAATRDVLANFFGGAVDNLRVYNYEIEANAIAQEYVDLTGIAPCIDSAFVGNTYNFDNTGSSYCRVDLVDFAIFAANWMADGLFYGN